MPMELERHEEILASLNDPELSHEERTNLLTELRSDYGRVLKDDVDYKKKVDDLEETNGDLLKTNSMLFRDLGERREQPATNQEEEAKTVSETITIKDLIQSN